MRRKCPRPSARPGAKKETEAELLPGPEETSLTERGYGIPKARLTPATVEALKKELTMTPIVAAGAPSTQGPTVSFPVFMESSSKLYVPRCFGLKRFGPPDRRTLAEGEQLSTGVAFTGRLRTEQLEPIAAFIAAARDPMRMGGILSLPCGFGKTVAALHVIAALGKRTLIIVHKDFLLNQWRERVREFLPGASLGTVKAQTVDVAGKDVVIASLQSLSMKDYDPDVLSGFGLLIVDECHRVGTEVFIRALHKVGFGHALGLSATVDRKDGMTKAFVHFLGDVLFKGKRRSDAVDVVQHPFSSADLEYCKEETVYGGNPNVSRMINNICEFEPRNRLIVDTIAGLIAAEPGRRVLVLSDRKSQLKVIKAGVEAAGLTAGFYWGGMKPADLAVSETKQVMCATFPYAAEGMDVPGLDTLVLASPKSDIEQSCGRILRQKADARERTPLIFDVADDFSLFGRQAAKRRAFFKKHAYTLYGSVAAREAGGLPSDPSDSDGEGEGEGGKAFAFTDLDE